MKITILVMSGAAARLGRSSSLGALHDILGNDGCIDDVWLA